MPSTVFYRPDEEDRIAKERLSRVTLLNDAVKRAVWMKDTMAALVIFSIRLPRSSGGRSRFVVRGVAFVLKHRRL